MTEITIPTRWDTMTDAEREISTSIGPDFWIEDDTIGVIDNRDRVRVDECLHVAARQLGMNGYCVTYGRADGLVFRLRVWGRSQRWEG